MAGSVPVAGGRRLPGGGTDPGRGGPTIRRIVLGSRLRRLRVRRGVGLDAAAQAIRASVPKMSRLERGQGGCKERDIADLLTLYAVTDLREREAYLALARGANTPGWWQQYGDLTPRWLETYLGLEEAATLIRGYQSHRVPDLLQTPAYAAALARLTYPDDSANAVARRVDLLERRQQVLARPDPPRCWQLIDEGALRRSVGGPAVMREQIRHLLRLHSPEFPEVAVHVVPLQTSAATALAGSVTLLRFAEADLPDIAYLEQLTGALYLDDPDDVERHRLAVDRLAAPVTEHTSTDAFLRRVLHTT